MPILDPGGLPTSLGEIINYKHHLDSIKHNYDKIIISFHTDLWRTGLHTNTPDWNEKRRQWDKYLTDIGRLFFSSAPYELKPISNRFAGDINQFVRLQNLRPSKAELGHILCKGKSLNIGEYVVLTTKTREIHRSEYDVVAPKFYSIMKEIGKKYKIVILGEQIVEMRKEYINLNPRPFGLYSDFKAHIPEDMIVDLSVKALGEHVSDIVKIQQDCLIMKEAKFTVTFGCGGNHCLSTAVSDMAIGYRTDNFEYNNIVFNYKEYPNAIITKSPDRFLRALEYYI